MPDLCNRRTWLAVLTLTGLTAAVPATIQGAQDPRDQSADLLKRLMKVSDLLDRADGRLTSIQEGFQNPPDMPELRAALNFIEAQAAAIAMIADDLLLRLGQP